MPPEFFTLRDDYALYRPHGEFDLDQTVDLIDNAVLYCRQNKITGLLVDVTGVIGLPLPSLSDRFWLITKWAETAKEKVILCLIVSPEMIAPDKIGVTIAANRGLRSDVFTTETDAVTWLQAELTSN